MRILHWYPNYLEGGGVSNSVLGLATYQSRLGADVAVAALESSGRYLYESIESTASVSVITWTPAFTVPLLGVKARIVSTEDARRVRAFTPDIVHIHGEFNAEHLWVPRLFQQPLVLAPHGAFHPTVLAKSRKWPKRIYLRAAQQLLYRHVDAFHALTPDEQRYIHRVVPTSTAYTVPQGPNVNMQYLAEERSSDHAGRAVRFLFVGRLDPYHKGLDVLLDAFAKARARFNGQPVTLTLVGPSWRGSLPHLQRRARELHVDDVTTFTGPVSGDEVQEHLRLADIYVQLSRYEGFPLSIAEALLAGRPAVLSRDVGTVSYAEVASLPHVSVVDLDVDEAADAIVHFGRRAAELNEVATQYRSTLRKFFSWEKAAKHHLEMYEEILH